MAWAAAAWKGLEALGWDEAADSAFYMTPDAADRGIIVPGSTIFDSKADAVVYALQNLNYEQSLGAMEEFIWDYMKTQLKWQVLQLQNGAQWYAMPHLKLAMLKQGVTLFDKRITAIMTFLATVIGLKRKRIEDFELERSKCQKTCFNALPKTTTLKSAPAKEQPMQTQTITTTNTTKKTSGTRSYSEKAPSPIKTSATEMNQQVPETPRRRSPRHTTNPSIRIPTPEVEMPAILETPRRRSPRRSIALIDSEVKEEEKPVPTTPLRRSPRRISAPLEYEQKEETPVPSTPSRRSARYSPSNEMKEEEQPIPDTPSRRSPSRVVVGAALDLAIAPQSTTSSLEQTIKIEFPILEAVATPKPRYIPSNPSTPKAATSPVVKDCRMQAPRSVNANAIVTKSEQISAKSTTSNSKPMVQPLPVSPKQPTPRKLIVPVPEASPVILSTPKKRARLAKDTPRTPIRTPTTMNATSNFPSNMLYESPVRGVTTPKKIGTPPSVTLFGSPEVKHPVSEWQPIFDKKPKRSPSNRRTTTFTSPNHGTPSKLRSKPPLARTASQEDDSPMSISHILSHQEVDTDQSMHANVARNLNITCFGPQTDDDMASFLSRTVKDSPIPRLKREIPTDFNAVSNAMNDLLDGAYNHLTQESPAHRQLDVKYAATPEFAVGASKAVPVLTPPKVVNLVFRRRVLTTFLSSGWRSVPPPMNGRGNYYYTHTLLNGISLSRDDVEQYAIDHDVFQHQINPLHVLDWVQKNRNSPLKTQGLKRKLLSPSTQRRFSFTN